MSAFVILSTDDEADFGLGVQPASSIVWFMKAKTRGCALSPAESTLHPGKRTR